MAATVAGLKNAVAFISGGATGLGRAVATSIVQNGGKVSVLDTDGEAGDKLAADLGHRCNFTQGSVKNRSDIEKAMKTGVKVLEKDYNLCLNCAAISDYKKMFNKKHGKANTNANFMEIIDVNITGTFNVMALFAKQFAERLGGERVLGGDPNKEAVIINKTFLYEGVELIAPYVASKGGIRSMTLPASREFASLGLRVCSISTGFFDTKKLQCVLSKNQQENFITGRMQPKFRLAQEEEFVHAVATVFQNKLLNGCDIELDKPNFLIFSS